jgi:hypothetical protein
MDGDAVAETLLQLRREWRLRSAAGAEQQPEWRADCVQAVSHAQYRCYADTSGDQQVLGSCLIQRESVLRPVASEN